MYHKYFGLKEAPFSIAPNPRYLFMSRRHKEALAHLLYGVNHGGGFVLLTGEVGTGKTTVSRALLKQLPQNTDIAYILNPTLSSVELLASICDELKVSEIRDHTSLKDLSDGLHKFLLENHARGRNTVLIIDEAQHLGYKVMEQIRLLTNLETDEKKLLQIVFIGQPELNELLAKPELRQLAQRITARFHIDPLTLTETQAYIRHRLMVAGMPPSQMLFTKAAIKIIFTACGGIPRLINVACDRALLGAYTHNSPQVDPEIAKAAVNEAAKAGQNHANRLPMILTTLLSLAIVAVIAWIVSRQLGWLAPTATSEPPAVVESGVIDRSAAPTPKPVLLPSAPISKANTEYSEEQILFASYASQEEATNALQQALDVFPGALDSPCKQLESFGIQCLAETLRSWEQLIDYNRPAVLTLEVAGERRYAAVIALDEKRQLRLLAHSGEPQSWPKFVLGQYWTGDSQILWQPPSSYQPALKPGERSPFVRWVAGSFATLDNQPKPLAEFHYNRELEQRVTLFQAENQLTADGIVGIRTVLKMNDALAADFSLVAPADGGQ
ncbi:ExeA family protein [Halioxenophilus sp. WMMB6]|uniref:ExeA family protein n=1 Tax=Halioxenophilus sp. WMMB6 TaxID=3073815 RepID=UPI00295E4522|nr:AAA family ATPase [Halioxenophilus sp. WMMB6]